MPIASNNHQDKSGNESFENSCSCMFCTSTERLSKWLHARRADDEWIIQNKALFLEMNHFEATIFKFDQREWWHNTWMNRTNMAKTQFSCITSQGRLTCSYYCDVASHSTRSVITSSILFIWNTHLAFNANHQSSNENSQDYRISYSTVMFTCDAHFNSLVYCCRQNDNRVTSRLL